MRRKLQKINAKKADQYKRYPSQVSDTRASSYNDDYLKTLSIQRLGQGIKTQISQKQEVFNRHIYKYKEDTNRQNSRAGLPFLSTLRRRQSYLKMKNMKKLDKITKREIVLPFNVANKICFSQLVRKSVCDFNSPNRVAQYYNIWNYGSDTQTKALVNFECTLRQYENPTVKFHKAKKQFNYLNTKIHNKFEQTVYTQKDIICPKIKKLVKISKRNSVDI